MDPPSDRQGRAVRRAPPGSVLLHPAPPAREREPSLRDVLLRTIQESPGITLSQLKEKTDSAWGTIYHHLSKLIAEGLVQTQSVGRRRLIYPRSMGAAAAQDAEARSLLYGATVRRIAAAIEARPHQSVATLAVELHDSPRAIYYHVRRLLAAGLIVSRSPTRHFDLCPAPGLKALLVEAAEGQDDAPT